HQHALAALRARSWLRQCGLVAEQDGTHRTRRWVVEMLVRLRHVARPFVHDRLHRACRLHSTDLMAKKVLVPVLPSDRFYDAVVAAASLLHAEHGGLVVFLFTDVRPTEPELEKEGDGWPDLALVENEVDGEPDRAEIEG